MLAAYARKAQDMQRPDDLPPIKLFVTLQGASHLPKMQNGADFRRPVEAD